MANNINNVAEDWSPLKKWAYENGLGEQYEEYTSELDSVIADLEAEGKPSMGSDFELIRESIREYYPDLFPPEEDEDDPFDCYNYDCEES